MNVKRRQKVLFILLISSLISLLIMPVKPAFSKTESPPQDKLRIHRLVNLCKVWGKVKHFHPYLAYKDIDWDRALIYTLPAVYSAKSDDDYCDAVDKMLAYLDDKITHVQRASKRETKKELPSLTDSITSQTIDGFLVITFAAARADSDYSDYIAAANKLKGIMKEMETARGVLLDFRTETTYYSNYSWLFRYSKFSEGLFKGTIFLPGSRSRYHFGFATQTSGGSMLYHSGFQVIDSTPVKGTASSEGKPLVFLVNSHSQIPEAALALQTAGKAVIVSSGPVSDASLADTSVVRLTDSASAIIRFSELVHPDGSLGITANVTLPEPEKFNRQGPAFDKAMAMLKSFDPVLPSSAKHYAESRPGKEKGYDEMTYPSRDYRLLSLFKAWNVFHYYFPYKDLMNKEDNWEEILARYIPAMEKAGNALEYGLVLVEMLSYTRDSHVNASSEALKNYFGDAVPPVFIRWVENQAVVCRLIDKKECDEAGIAIGDIILKVEGQPVAERMKEMDRYIIASTPQSRLRSKMKRLVQGKDNSPLQLTIKNSKNDIQTVSLTRRKKYYRGFWPTREGKVFKLLNKDIGYADLDRLTTAQVDRMLDAFKDTRGIIFDMRGYPKGTAWSIAPRLAEDKGITAAKFKGIVATGGDYRRMNYFFDQPVPHTNKWIYKGKTVMLINEYTVSQAEHTGLFLEAANGTTFIGSGTTGANGDVTSLVLPGGVTARFTGQAVKHADGRQLQRIGLIPHIKADATIEGLRKGQDEVLQRAVNFLEKQWAESAK